MGHKGKNTDVIKQKPVSHLEYQELMQRQKAEAKLNAIGRQVLSLLGNFCYLMYETLQSKMIFYSPSLVILL